MVSTQRWELPSACPENSHKLVPLTLLGGCEEGAAILLIALILPKHLLRRRWIFAEGI